MRNPYDREVTNSGSNNDPRIGVSRLARLLCDRARYKGDGLKNQRTVSELPIPEPAVFVYDPEGTGQNFADVVLASTFDEALAFLGKPYHPHGGRFALHLLRAEREQIERDTRVAYADEIAAYENQQPGTDDAAFLGDRCPVFHANLR